MSLSIVMPAKAGIQYSEASRLSNAVSGILDRPVEPGDDSIASGYLTVESENIHVVLTKVCG